MVTAGKEQSGFLTVHVGTHPHVDTILLYQCRTTRVRERMNTNNTKAALASDILSQ